MHLLAIAVEHAPAREIACATQRLAAIHFWHASTLFTYPCFKFFEHRTVQASYNVTLLDLTIPTDHLINISGNPVRDGNDGLAMVGGALLAPWFWRYDMSHPLSHPLSHWHPWSLPIFLAGARNPSLSRLSLRQEGRTRAEALVEDDVIQILARSLLPSGLSASASWCPLSCFGSPSVVRVAARVTHRPPSLNCSGCHESHPRARARALHPPLLYTC